MDESIGRLRLEGPKLWNGLSVFQRLTLLAVVVGAVGAAVWLSQWAQQPEYAAAYTKLSDGDASAIVTKLKELKVPYELSDGGTTVKVPSDRLYDVRLQLASAGLPKGGSTGFELFDKVSFGLTDFAQKLNYQRALEGELARTIGRISGVEEARVHLVMPQAELFSSQQKPPTASVVLMLRSGAEPDPRQVKGIASLVARSVEGLKPENVTVLDGAGNIISGSDDSFGGIAAAGTQSDAQRAYERNLQRDLQAMLQQVLGPSKAVVKVSAAFSWDQYESTAEKYLTPEKDKGVVRSSKDLVERSDTPPGDSSGTAFPTYPGDQTTPAGPPNRMPSASPTVTGQQAAQASATATPTTTTAMTASASATAAPKYERRENTTNYEVSKVVEHTVTAPGALKRLSVSVVLDGSADNALIDNVTKTVKAAAGFDEKRGDTVIVTSVPFDRSATAAEQAAYSEARQQSTYFEYARNAGAALSVLIVLLVVRSILSGLSKPSRTAPRALPDAPRVTVSAPRRPIIEQDERPLLAQSEVAELARSQPKLVAGILKTWLDER